MRGRKPVTPVVQTDNVVRGPFAGAAPVEPDWMMAFPDGEWGSRAAEIASERWTAVIAAMQGLRTLAAENYPDIEAYSVNYARWKLAEAHVTLHGPIVPAPRTGVPMRNPYLEVANGAQERFSRIGGDLGLPPSMRGRVGKAAAAKQGATSSDRFLGSKKTA